MIRKDWSSYECPVCGAKFRKDRMICPKCGVEFEGTKEDDEFIDEMIIREDSPLAKKLVQ